MKTKPITPRKSGESITLYEDGKVEIKGRERNQTEVRYGAPYYLEEVVLGNALEEKRKAVVGLTNRVVAVKLSTFTKQGYLVGVIGREPDREHFSLMPMRGDGRLMKPELYNYTNLDQILIAKIGIASHLLTEILSG